MLTTHNKICMWRTVSHKEAIYVDTGLDWANNNKVAFLSSLPHGPVVEINRLVRAVDGFISVSTGGRWELW